MLKDGEQLLGQILEHDDCFAKCLILLLWVTIVLCPYLSVRIFPV